MIHFRLTDRVNRTRTRSVPAEPESRLKKTDGHTTLLYTHHTSAGEVDAYMTARAGLDEGKKVSTSSIYTFG